MTRWFRLYDEMLDDPKVQLLSPELFKSWVNILCLASRNKGKLPTIQAMAFALRISTTDMQAKIDELILSGLVDIKNDKTLEPHNWSARQWKSDDSADRVKRHRNKMKLGRNADVTVTVTAPDTETDTETDSASAESCAPLPEISHLEKLSDKLHEAAGACLANHAIAPGLFSMMVPQMWLDHGCDLERDVLPTIRNVAAKGKRGISTWDYFSKPVSEARTKRLAGLPTVDLSQPMQRGGRLDMTRLAAMVTDSPPEAFQ